MRISDWSSGVCSSDLQPAFGRPALDHRLPVAPGAGEHVVHAVDRGGPGLRTDHDRDLDRGACVVGWLGHWRISRVCCGNGFVPGTGPALPWNPPTEYSHAHPPATHAGPDLNPNHPRMNSTHSCPVSHHSSASQKKNPQ